MFLGLVLTARQVMKGRSTRRSVTPHHFAFTNVLRPHNTSNNRSTKSGVPWKLVYYEAYEQKSDALRREKKLKHHARGLIELKKRITIAERNGEGAGPR